MDLVACQCLKATGILTARRRTFLSTLRTSLSLFMAQGTCTQEFQIMSDGEVSLKDVQKTYKLKEIEISEMHVEMLPPEGKVKFLGQMTTFLDQETTEVQHRIRCAWSTFTKHRQELTSQSYLLRRRLHLFDAVLTPTITHGAGTWARTKEHENILRTAQCRMLRLIIQKRKYKNEEELGE